MIAIAISLTGYISAQTSDEWLRQKKTQKKYLFQQIAALQAYSDFLSKGYSVVKNGLNAVQHIKHGDLHLHANYFTSLVTINSKVKRCAKIADIISMQLSIAKQSAKAIRNFRNNRQCTNAELDYLKTVVNNLLNDCAKNLDELYNLTANGDLKMKDDERIKAIDKLYAEMQDKKMFISAFCDDAAKLGLQRAHEESEINITKKLNNIK